MSHRGGSSGSKKAGHSLFALFGRRPVREGEEAAFLDMLGRSQRSIFQICLYFTDRQADSIRDLYQEIVCTLWEAWPRFRGESSTDTWVHRIALNVAVSEIRSHARQPRFVPLEDWMYDTVADEVDKAPPDYYRIMDDLEPDERALIYLRLSRHSVRDIAETFSITEAAVKQRLYRIRKKIDLIKQREYDEE